MRTVVVLMTAVFTVSIEFGIILPLLPFLIARRLRAGGPGVAVDRPLDDDLYLTEKEAE